MENYLIEILLVIAVVIVTPVIFNLLHDFFTDVYTVSLTKWKYSIGYGFLPIIVMFILFFAVKDFLPKFVLFFSFLENIMLALGFITASMLIGLILGIDGYHNPNKALIAGSILLLLVHKVPVLNSVITGVFQFYGFGTVISYFVFKRKGVILESINMESKTPAMDLFKSNGENIRKFSIIVLVFVTMVLLGEMGMFMP